MNKVVLGSYGFRFNEGGHNNICQLYAVGHEVVTNLDYSWDGHTRSDGPLLLFQYTISGSGAITIGPTTHKLNAEQAFLVEIPGQHRYYFPAHTKQWEFFYILFRPTLVDSIWKQIVNKLSHITDLPKQSEPILLLNTIIRQAKRGKIQNAYEASALVYQFMMALSAYTFQKGSEKGDWPEQIKLATRYMEHNYADAALQEQLAVKLGLSPYQFIRLFNRFVGVTPGEYLSRIKIDQAIKLLLETKLPIEQIAEKLGYSSGSYFIRVFHQRIGETPAKFRKANELTYNHIYYD